MRRSATLGRRLANEPFVQNAMAEVRDTGIRGGNTVLGEQFADGATGDASFAKRRDVLFEGQ